MKEESNELKSEEGQQPIPAVWRKTIREIVEAFADGDFTLSRGIVGVARVSEKDAESIERNIAGYGAHLTELSEKTWETSACQWMLDYWDALIDLYTVEEGASDLVLALRIYETEQGYDFNVLSIHVP